MFADLDKAKKALRLAIRADLLAVVAEVRSSLSDTISNRLLALPQISNAPSVLVFLPMPHEPDLTNLARKLLQDGVTVCVPRIDWDKGTFHAAQVTSVDDGLEIRRYKVPEPSALARRVDPASIDVVLTPALAFDRLGNRLGHGAGMYDRFLASAGLRAWVCGVGFESQLVANLPIGPNDKKLDAVATDRRLLLYPRHQRQGVD